jgi:7-carboxy-7-deazaguanine synthase
MKLARLNNKPEIFYSIQGEGVSIGKPAIFVRLSQCNLHCVWCDTSYTWNWEGTKFEHPIKVNRKVSQVDVSINELVELITDYPCSRVILTGGEPFIQQKELVGLMTALKAIDDDYFFEIETNGTFEPLLSFDRLIGQYNVSTKLSNCGDAEKLRIKTEAMEFFTISSKANFKFVIESEKDLDEVQTLQRQFGISKEKILLMPQAQTKETLQKKQEELIEICKNFGYTYSDRLHVRIYGDKKGI